MIKKIAFAAFPILAFSFGVLFAALTNDPVAAASLLPSMADRPANVWHVVTLGPRGGRRHKIYDDTPTIDDAIAKARAEYGPDVFVLCAAHAYYGECLRYEQTPGK